MPIKILDDQTINKIAAGEVVERPSSVVRELVDNAIDAGASEIIISLIDGGKEQIKVSDNGSGMSRDDALLAFERHATSKISAAEDLTHIATMGFRGEALAAISSVSKAYLKTRTQEAEVATTIYLEGGKLKNTTNTTGQKGSTIEIANLFFNTPARKKFLKSRHTEEAKVKSWIQNTSLANPQVSYRLYFDEKEILNLAAVQSATQRAEQFLPQAAIKIKTENIEAVLAHPSLSLADSSGLAILVNGRVVSDRLSLRAIKDAFGMALKSREFPVGFISLRIPAEEVDVNVHPQKSEVKFLKPQSVFHLVKTSIEQALRNFKSPVEIRKSYQPEKVEPVPVEYSQPGIFSTERQSEYEVSRKIFSVAENTIEKTVPKESFSGLNYIGKALDCFLLCEKENDLYIVDMHAAHERYNYNLIRNNFRKKTPDSQILLLPKVIQLTEEQINSFIEKKDILEGFGFAFEVSGKDKLLVKAIPSVLASQNYQDLLKEVASDEVFSAEVVYEKTVDYVAARIACHASIRSGDTLSRQGVNSLFSSLDNTEFSAACPHGRPVIVKVTKYEIEKWFGR